MAVPIAALTPAAILAVVATVSLTSCNRGGSGPAAPAAPAAPALRPSGDTARHVQYRCRNGKRNTLLVSIENAQQLADTLNSINICEFDRGLAEVELDIGCTTGAPVRSVRVLAVNGQLPATSFQDLCGP